MAISQPASSDALNSPDHSLMHRIIASDPGASVQSLTVSTTDIAISPTDGVNVTLGNDAGDDFIIDSTSFVVEGDTGNVGIGTDAPSQLLHIEKNQDTGTYAKIVNTNTHANTLTGFQLISDDSLLQLFALHDGYDSSNELKAGYGIVTGSNNGLILAASGATEMEFWTNSNERMTIDSAGNVGIGNDAPATKLDLRDGNFILSDADATTTFTDAYSATAFAQLNALSGTNGGLQVTALTNADAVAMELFGWIGVTDPTDTIPVVLIKGGKSNGGTSWAALADAETLLQVRNFGTNVVTVLGSGNVGIGTTSPTNLLSLGGESARIFWMERELTANTAGNTLTITAGGATTAATDKAGGALILQGGLSTGSAESGVTIQGCVAGAGGTADRTQTTEIQVLGNKIGFYGVTPITRAVLATGGGATVDNVITALQNLGLVSQS